MTIQRSDSGEGRRRHAAAHACRLVLAAAALVFAACDLKVLNPAMISDEELNDPQVLKAVITGAASDVGYAALVPGYGGLFVIGSVLTDELVATDTRVGPRTMSDGRVRDDVEEAQSWWGYAAQARWTTEAAVERARDLVPDPDADSLVATASVWAGFANRINGDAFCDAVIDGGPLEPYTVYFERAERYFTDAIAVATAAGIDTLVTAAYAGRAQSRMMLGNWAGAVADAAMVPNEFMFVINNSTAGRNLNRYWTYGRSNDGRYVVWGTPFQEWGMEWTGDRTQGDPRVIWEVRTSGNQVLIGPDGRRPWYALRKYLGTGDDVPLVRGTEMRLIEAEAALVAGDWQTAIDKINGVRDFRNATRPSTWGTNTLEHVTASSLEEAWFILMKERGIELWLEGRRLPDLRRWAVHPGKEHVPFKVVRLEAPTPNAEEDPRVSVYDVSNELCFEVSEDERLSNPNIGS